MPLDGGEMYVYVGRNGKNQLTLKAFGHLAVADHVIYSHLPIRDRDLYRRLSRSIESGLSSISEMCSFISNVQRYKSKFRDMLADVNVERLCLR